MISHWIFLSLLLQWEINVSFIAVADASVNLQSRTFKSLTEAAEEAGMSRFYGGVHWPWDNRDGLKAGRNLGKYVVEKF